MGVKLLRYLPQSPDEQSRRTSERCEQRREEVKKKLSSNGVKKPVLEMAKQPKPLMEVQQQQQQQQLKRNHRAELETHLGSTVPYKIATMGSARRLAYMASVVVEGEQYKTYPQTFPSQAEAEEALAALVLDKRGVQTGQVGKPVEPGVTRDILQCAERVLQLLDQKPTGVWSSQLETDYLRKWSERPAPDWLTKMEELAIVRTHSPLPDSQRCVVFSTCSDLLGSLPPPPRLPDDDVWQVLVTTIECISRVTIRLLGETWAGRLDALLGDMDLHYFQDNSPLPAVEVGKVYAAQAASEWHRVRVESLAEDTCVCLFLDHGDTDTIALTDLRKLKPEFLMLPPQAFPAEVAGLQEFQQREAKILPTVNQLLLGKSLMAKVEDRASLGPRLGLTNMPSLVFFDTSSAEEDLNINQKLIETIVSEDSKSKLPAVGAEEIQVRVSSITDTGDLFVVKVPDVAEQSCPPTQEPEGDLSSLPEEAPEQRRLICRLAGVPPEGHSWSRKATAALRDLVAEDEVVTLRVLSLAADGCPQVELHLLEDSHGSINFDLSTEFDIFPPCTASLEPTYSNPTSPSPDALLPLPPASLPAPGSLLNLRVTHAVSPDSFTIRLAGEGLDVGDEMGKFYGEEAEEVSKGLVPGESFYALHSGGHWQRVEVSQTVGSGEGAQAVVRLVDEGGKAVVGVDQLRYLPEQFRCLPCQALTAALACIHPLHGEWTPEDNYWFNQRVSNRQLVGVVHAAEQDLEQQLLLELRDPVGTMAVHRQLVEEGRAKLL